MIKFVLFWVASNARKIVNAGWKPKISSIISPKVNDPYNIGVCGNVFCLDKGTRSPSFRVRQVADQKLQMWNKIAVYHWKYIQGRVSSLELLSE